MCKQNFVFNVVALAGCFNKKGIIYAVAILLLSFVVDTFMFYSISTEMYLLNLKLGFVSNYTLCLVFWSFFGKFVRRQKS